jgi:hypothetical protein
MTDQQILDILMILDGAPLIIGIFIALHLYRETRDNAEKSRELEQLISAALEGAREILRKMKR